MVDIFPAATEHIALLAQLNKQLIEDEKHDNPMTEAELALRMAQFLEHDYRAFLFYDEQFLVGYALVNITRQPFYVRQFFIGRTHRGQGVGKRCFSLLKQSLNVTELDVEVLTHNSEAIRFWKSVGFLPRSMYMTLRQHSE